MKRASRSAQVGSIAESHVQQVFEEMGWGPVAVSRHDDGIDYLVQVRDEDLYELGLLLGAQVKDEADYFKPPHRTRALHRNPPGWFYRAKIDDVEYWLNHATPQILVLRDRETKTCYWSHISSETVGYTPRGAKIWVPAENKLDSTARNALLKVATSKKTIPVWWGSTWDGVENFSCRQLLRTAVLVPRLLQPHGNKPREHLSSFQALAMAVRGSWEGLQRYEMNGLLKPSSTGTQAPQWQIFMALQEYLDHGDVGNLEGLANANKESPEAAATAALTCAAFFELGRAADASNLLRSIPIDSFNDPVDRAWMRLHIARCLWEQGKIGQAEKLAIAASEVGVNFPQDPTAVALRAVGMQLVSLGTVFKPDHLSSLVRARDTPPMWWRDQDRSQIVGACVDRDFHAAVGEPPNEVDRSSGHQRLRGLVLVAGASADHLEWSRSTKELAKFEFAVGRHARIDDAEFGTILRDMRLAGGDDDVALMAGDLVNRGPMDPVVGACRDLDLSLSTKTSIAADLTILRVAADVVESPDADRHAKLLVAAYMRQVALPFVNWAEFAIRQSILRVLTALYPQLSQAVRETVLDLCLDQAASSDQPLREEFAQLFDVTQAEDWSAVRQSRLKTSLHRLESEPDGEGREALRASIRQVLIGCGDAPLLEQQLAALQMGSAEALSSIRWMHLIDEEHARSLITRSASRIMEKASSVEEGAFTLNSGVSWPRVLMSANLEYPNAAQWGPVELALRTPSFRGEYVGLLRDLERRAPDLPRSAAGPIASAVSDLANAAVNELPGLHRVIDIAGQARRVALALRAPFASNETLLLRLTATSRERASVAAVLANDSDAVRLPLLMALAGDGSFEVRQAAALAAAKWITSGSAPRELHALAKGLLEERGRGIHMALLSGLGNCPATDATWLLQILACSPSGQVRRRAESLLSAGTRETS